MTLFSDIHSQEEKLEDQLLNEAGIELYVKREDLLHPQVSGNKWRKLKYNIANAISEGNDSILSFGGAFSNHIYSLAAAGKIAGIKTIGMIRGEETLPLNPTLSFARSCGMELHYLDRETYKLKEKEDFLKDLKKKFPNSYFVPEGGSNVAGVKGCEEIIADIQTDFDIICIPVGSGGTMAGLVSAIKGTKKVLGFSALKGDGILDDTIISLIPGREKWGESWEIVYDYHFGGYAKISSTLIEFILEFEKKHSIKLEPVYTGKMFYGLFDMIKKGQFAKGTKIVAIHTGGLQGLNGMEKKIKNIIQQKPLL